jgi:hypothetical protein
MTCGRICIIGIGFVEIITHGMVIVSSKILHVYTCHLSIWGRVNEWVDDLRKDLFHRYLFCRDYHAWDGDF